MLELGLALSGAALRGPSWSPSALFGGTADGLWLDPGRLDGLWQDAAGTVAATDVGQPVGLVRDQSGNGRDFAQGTSSARPTLQRDGAGRHFLQFDGVDDWLSCQSFAWGSDEVTVVAGIVRNQNVAMEDVIGLSLNPPGYAGTWRLSATHDASSNTSGFGTRGNGTDVHSRSPGMTVGTSFVLSAQGKVGTDLATIRRNRIQVGQGTADQGTGQYGTYPLFLGARGGTTRYLNGALYALVAFNRLLTDEELRLLEDWVAARCGVAA